MAGEEEHVFHLKEGGRIVRSYLPVNVDLDREFPVRHWLVETATGEAWLTTLPNHHRALILDERKGGAAISLTPGRRVTLYEFDRSAAARRVRHEIIHALIQQGKLDTGSRGGAGSPPMPPVVPIPLPRRDRRFRILPVPPVIRVPRPPQRTK
jgi:hypothetical protein